ncbi:hypothetical protein FOA52_012402 [Chlamydomonas sp. UWO 241]|nr:hypothetical protein FOA52_012402 [Chlamydomonas sp. UWO 241]
MAAQGSARSSTSSMRPSACAGGMRPARTPAAPAPRRVPQSGRGPAPPASSGYDASAVDEGVLKLAATKELRLDQITHVYGWARDLTDKYVLGRALGAGSFGVVREATEVATGKRYAVKTIGKVPKNKMSSPYYLRKLRAEVEIMQQLGGSLNAVNLHAAFEDDVSVHMVQQICEGGALLERVDSKKYTETYVVFIVRSMLRFLSQCHAKGFIYRDVKPDNFLFHTRDVDSPLKATDFGLSIRHLKGQPKLTSRSGTPAYMAPELIMQSYDEKCDVWSVGMLTYQLLTGRFPFWADVRRESLADVWKAILTRKLDWEADELRLLSPAAIDFLKKLVTRNPDERLSAEQALQHPWMVERSGTGDPLLGSVVQRLQRFSTYGALKQLVLRIIADEALSVDSAALAGGVLPTFQALSPQLMEGLQELFTKLDADGSGSVSLEELTKGVRALGYSLSDNEMELLMRRVDVDKSGCVSSSEFFTTIVDWNKVKESDAWQAYVDFAFNKLDSDGNGTIDVDELVALLPETQVLEERVSVAKAMLREADVNGDGKITREEFGILLEHQRLVDSLSFYDSRLSTESLSSINEAAAAVDIFVLSIPVARGANWFLAGGGRRMDEEEATAAAAERIAAAAEDGTSLPVRLATDVVRFLNGGTGRREPADGGVVSASLLNAKPAVGGIGVEPCGGGVLRVLFTVASDAVADTVVRWRHELRRCVDSTAVFDVLSDREEAQHQALWPAFLAAKVAGKRAQFHRARLVVDGERPWRRGKRATAPGAAPPRGH